MDDLIIVGAGWAGLTAAAYALERGAKVRLIAQGIGSPIVSPGWISAWDSTDPRIRIDLETALPELIQKVSDHPYALAGFDALVGVSSFFVELSKKIDLPYVGSLVKRDGSRSVMQALGNYQHPAIVPESYLVESAPPHETTVFVDFEDWRDYFPALESASTARIATVKVRLPLVRLWDASPTDLARQFDEPSFRAEFAARLKPLIGNTTSIGMPAVIGLEHSAQAKSDLELLLYPGRGIPIFEIPTLPPSVQGTRLFNKLRRYFLDNGVRMQIGHPVTRGLIENGRVVGVEVAAAGKPQRFYAKNVILATGGLYGGGLFSDDRGRIWEPIFNLPVKHDSDRTRWFNDNLLDPRGHPIHYIGVRANNRMQPLDEHGDPVAEGLYVAGHILAHPEGGPPPFETSEGVALATAYRAVQCALVVAE